ncbi:Zn-ribbon domain-containing OB-fold protein [Verticiella sediminum]|uniref:Zn-ribbon domain-containing OB-fold protein n=1 Tax=Verticiella sediminum TaxID=1247510 RepID=A0A556B1E1_9BURK|nr:Zn-ribbon domain-containing OB-fold protein [Verticiella sediminum]TSH98990.1 Zn-ribbon domain-containing OB-fold protein [Verticiella sediminum]
MSATNEYTKPLPTISDDNRPFWEACRDQHLAMQQCDSCNHIRFPISHCCPRCLSTDFHWQRLSGKGTVFSYVVFHQVYNRAFAQDVPYNVALVQLDEGPRMYSNVVGVPNDAVKVGDRLEAVFDRVTPDITIPRFRLAESKA